MSDGTSKQRILIVEESATLRYMLGKIIQKQGYELFSVDGFSSAIETLSGATHYFHGVLVGWPNYEHFEFSKELLVFLDREPYSEVPVILLSNDAELDLLNWMSTRKSTALIPWESYQEVAASLQSMLAPPVKPVIEKPRSLQQGKPIKVLFVDDSNSIRVYYQRLLERNHYEVFTACSVSEAYDIATTEQVDIAITDYFMPDENGYVLCQRLRDNPATSGIRTAVITGTYLDAVITDCLQAGAIECMFKNEAEELFIARIAAIRRFIEIQRSIEKQRENLSAILESVGEGVFGVDKQGCLTFMNSAALTALGLDEVKTVLGKQAAEVFHISEQETRTNDLLKEAYLSGEKLKSWETTFRHSNGKHITVDCTLFPLVLDNKLEGSVVAFRDISDRKMLEEKLRWQATHDHLTSLYNRRYFENYLESEIMKAQRTGILSAVVYMDIDRFKYVNDTAGHDTGDRILIDLSQILTKYLRRYDVAARIGGDEFAIILKNVNAELAIKLTNDIRHALSVVRVRHEKEMYHINASFGVAIMDEVMLENGTITAGDLMANADIACHISKRMGGDQTHIYERSSDERNIMGTELGWSARVREALAENRFELHFQPIMQMKDIDLINLPAQDGVLWQRHLKDTDKIYSYEVLVRMKGEDGELHYPDSFIPTAERFNLMVAIDLWVLEHSLQEMVLVGISTKIRLSINISGHTVDSNESLEKIKRIIKKYGVSPSALTFEVTETSAIANLEQANDFITELRKIGCHFSLDDFGSGFCSFAQLKNLPTDYVKIDGQFVKSMARGATDRAIVTAMNDVAHSLGRYTVAEYVESPEIVRLLKICGVDKVQGNYISEPLTALPTGNIVSFYNKKESGQASPV